MGSFPEKYNDSNILASVVQGLDSPIHRINLYPMCSAISFPMLIHWVVSDLSGG